MSAYADPCNGDEKMKHEGLLTVDKDTLLTVKEPGIRMGASAGQVA